MFLLQAEIGLNDGVFVLVVQRLEWVGVLEAVEAYIINGPVINCGPTGQTQGGLEPVVLYHGLSRAPAILLAGGSWSVVCARMKNMSPIAGLHMAVRKLASASASWGNGAHGLRPMSQSLRRRTLTQELRQLPVQ